MPGSMQSSGTAELMEMLGKLGDKAPEIASQALYVGAGITADGYKQAVENIKTAPRRHDENGKRLATAEEKEALRATGVARFKKSTDSVDTVVGVAEGYAYPRGKKKAIKLLARSINSGTSFMKKQPVFRKAASTNRKAAQDAMVATAQELISQIAK